MFSDISLWSERQRLRFIEDDEGERFPILNEKKQLEWVALEEVGR